MQKMCQKLPTSALLVFPTTVSWESTGRKNTKNANVSMFLHLTGPLMAKLFHILVEEVISFKMSGLTSKSVKN